MSWMKYQLLVDACVVVQEETVQRDARLAVERTIHTFRHEDKDGAKQQFPNQVFQETSLANAVLRRYLSCVSTNALYALCLGWSL